MNRFIERDLIYRYGALEKIVTDNAQNFNERMIVELCIKKIKHLKFISIKAKMNGVVPTNKNIKKIMQKMVVMYKDCMHITP